MPLAKPLAGRVPARKPPAVEGEGQVAPDPAERARRHAGDSCIVSGRLPWASRAHVYRTRLLSPEPATAPIPRDVAYCQPVTALTWQSRLCYCVFATS